MGEVIASALSRAYFNHLLCEVPACNALFAK